MLKLIKPVEINDILFPIGSEMEVDPSRGLVTVDGGKRTLNVDYVTINEIIGYSEVIPTQEKVSNVFSVHDKSDPCPDYSTLGLALSIAEDMDERGEYEIELANLYAARKKLSRMIKSKREDIKRMEETISC